MKIVTKAQKYSFFQMFTRFLLLLFICILPFQVGTYFFQSFSYVSGVRVDYLAPSLYLIDIVAAAIILFHVPLLIKNFGNKRTVLLFALLSINACFSLVPQLSIYTSVRLFMILALYHIYKQTDLPSRTILFAFLAGGLFETILAVSQMITLGSLQGVFYFAGERYFTLSTPGIAKASLWGQEILRPYGTFSHPNSLAGFYLLVYVFVLTGNLFRNSRYTKYAVLFISSLLVFLSFSKAAFATLVVLSAVYLLKNRTLTCNLCKFARIAGLTVLFVIIAVAQTDPRTLAKRAELIVQSIRIFTQHPVLGVGLGNYPLSAARFPTPFLDSLNQPVHSIYLLLLTELGTVGVVTMIIAALPFIKKVLKAAPYVAAAVLITGGFDHYWITLKQNSMLLGVLFGLLL